MPDLEKMGEILQAEIDKGHVVNVDEFCRMVAPHIPHLSHNQIQDMVIAAVGHSGGGASRGDNRDNGGGDVWKLSGEPAEAERKNNEGRLRPLGW
ncbi:hypothetical protein [Aestuariivirga sp.]|uniref:hypothetical protein n=1 Tax=Aestuariivirga sp. TaxID=2650926 RepID=UPI003918F4DF